MNMMMGSCCYVCLYLLMTILISVGVFLALFLIKRSTQSDAVEKRACLVVLGDIGRSPRMQYHARSLSEHGFLVDIIGFGGSLPHKDIMNDKKIHLVHLKEFLFKGVPVLLRYILKVTVLVFLLLHAFLFRTHKHSLIIIQNPPSIPGMFIVWLVCLLDKSMFIIDWHNYGHTILALTLGPSHFIVKLTAWFERYFGRRSARNICVTHAMRTDLEENWGIRAVTLYDKPPKMFQPSTVDQKHELFTRLSSEYVEFRGRQSEQQGAVSMTMGESDENESSCFTKVSDNGSVGLCSDRPALIVSSTSWTEDEDFPTLLSALEKYDNNLSDSQSDKNLPDIVCVITGKGPLKDVFKSVISKKKFAHVKLCTSWLSAEDYPILLGSADLGVCLHTSSSGLDLPMKVVDMFGCGLPVCAISFRCLSELVVHGKNGLVFQDDKQLSEQLQQLLTGFPNPDKLNELRQNLTDTERWTDEWDRIVLPMIS